MGRFSSSSAHGFRVRYLAPDHYRLSWVVDYYYHGSRLRYPRRFARDTDRSGAERFCKRHGVPMQETLTPETRRTGDG